MRIPTVLGLSIVTVGLVAGVIKTLSLTQYLPVSRSEIPISIRAVNITDTQASIIWQTQQPTIGKLRWGNSSPENLKNDDRDLLDRKRVTHFFTLKNLRPDTSYYYIAQDDNYTYPNRPLRFTTAKAQLNKSNTLEASPIIGVIVDPALQPIDEAIVTLESPSTLPVSAFTITAGNFLIPTSQILNSQSNSYFTFDSPLRAQLVVRRGAAVSIVKLTLPLEQATLPNIVLGNNLDLTLEESSPSAVVTPSPTATNL